jgi:hypothetical protein
MFGLELLPAIKNDTSTVLSQLELFRQGLNVVQWRNDGNYRAINGKLDLVLALLKSIQLGGVNVTQELQSLTEEVSRNTAVDQSAIQLLNGLAEKIEAIKQDPIALQALASDMRASSDALAAAVVANTPAAPST